MTKRIMQARVKIKPEHLVCRLLLSILLSVAATPSRLGVDSLEMAAQQQTEVETFYIRKGANGTLPCLPVSSGDNQATLNKIEWLKEEKKLVEAENRQIVEWKAKKSIAYLPETGSLLFRGVTNEDSGEYHCLMTKQATGETEDGVVRFYVQGKFNRKNYNRVPLNQPANQPTTIKRRRQKQQLKLQTTIWQSSVEGGIIFVPASAE